MSLTVPAGDPDTLRRVVTTISTLARTVGERRGDRLTSLGGTAESALPPARVAAFASARADAVKGTGAVGLSLTTVGSALGDWAAALETAQTTIRGAARRHAEAETAWRRARSLGEADLQELYRQDMVAEARTADGARSTLDEARRLALGALRGEIDLWVPDGGTLRPVEAWQRAAVGAAPARLALDPRALWDAYRNPDAQLAKDAVLKAVKGATKGYQLHNILTYVRAPGLTVRSERKFLEARNLYQAIKGSAPDLTNRSVYRSYLRAERAMLRAYVGNDSAAVRRAQILYKQARGLLGDARALQQVRTMNPGLTAAQVVGRPGRFDALARPLRALSPLAARVLGPLGVVTGGLDVHTAITDDSMDTDDRVARGVGGAATVVGGGATALMAFGVIATGPVGIGVVAVAGVVAVGSWVYENREAIAEGARKAGSAIASGAKKVGGAIAGGAKKAWKGLFG